MSSETNLFCNITFNSQTFNSEYEVSEKIEELDRLIATVKNRLHALALMTEPLKFFPDLENDKISEITIEVEEQLKELEDYYIERYKLQQLLDNWDYCHNSEGLAIDPPENISWDTAFLDGDFVRSVKYPNKDKLL